MEIFRKFCYHLHKKNMSHKAYLKYAHIINTTHSKKIEGF